MFFHHFRLIGFQQSRFGFFILICMLCNSASLMMGLAISAVATDVDHASAVGVPIMILSILFGGFYISIDSLPIVANWIPYITIFRWAYQALSINEFKGLNFSCDSTDTTQCILTGEEVLETLDFANHTTAYPCFGLGMVLLGMVAIAFTNLQLSTITYTHLGHVGGSYTKYSSDAPSPRPSEKDKEKGYEMVATHSAAAADESEPEVL